MTEEAAGRDRSAPAVTFSRSLFWTFAGSFLAVVAVATVLQGFVLVAVVGKLAEQQAAGQARAALEEAQQRLWAEAPAPGAATSELLLQLSHRRPAAEGAVLLVFRRADGGLDAPWRLSEEEYRRLMRLLEAGPGRETAGSAGVVAAASPRPRPLSETGAARPPEGLLPPPGRLRLFEVGEVRRGGERIGQVAAFGRIPDRRSWRTGDAVFILSFLPLALLLAAGAGLVLFRRLTGRLHRLEEWAARVEAGELEARVPEARDDEIGSLAGRLQRMTTRLAEARDEIKAAEEQRRLLLADISHELATPLTSIRASAETLLDAEVPMTAEERRQFLGDLLGEARRMDLLIKDLFELTRLESRASDLSPERLDWAALCRHTVDRYRARFEQAGLRLRAVGPVEIAWVHADGRRLEQVLENLLGNALRYVSAPGTVTVGLEALAHPKRYRLRVEDDGPGIPEKDLSRIFDRFYRSDRDRSSPGSGLGLAIVKELVERHGGRVMAANRRGVSTGAVLSVELPAADPPEEAVATEP